MKKFLNKILLLLAFGNMAFANCNCNTAVTVAYMTETIKVKQYYGNLQEKINKYSDDFSAFEEAYAQTQKRREEDLEILKLRKVSIAQQKQALSKLYSIPVNSNNVKNEILESELLMLK